METRADLVAAPAPVTIDGADYLMTPLRDLDLGELDRWVQSKILEVAELSNDETTRRLAIEVAAMAEWAGKYGAALAKTHTGVARYMLVSLRVKQPFLTFDKVLGWVKRDDIRLALLKAFNLTNGLNTRVPANPTPGLSTEETSTAT